MVGIILVSALVVLPASFGMLISRNYRNVILASVIFTLLTIIGGLFLSYFLDSPAGATMVVLGAAIYFITMLFKPSL
jgi:zinc transport system permease protein